MEVAMMDIVLIMMGVVVVLAMMKPGRSIKKLPTGFQSNFQRILKLKMLIEM